MTATVNSFTSSASVLHNCFRNQTFYAHNSKLGFEATLECRLKLVLVHQQRLGGILQSVSCFLMIMCETFMYIDAPCIQNATCLMCRPDG